MDEGESPIRLVVNADDFGRDAAVSRGILQAARDGIVTSTSVVGNCADPAAAAALLAGAPGLGVGAALVLVAGTPVSPPGEIRSLLDGGHAFPAHARTVYLRWGRGQLRIDEIEREFSAQIARLRDAGLTLDHLNIHRHLGFMPPVGRALEAVARQHGIAGIRMAVEKPNLGWLVEARRGAMTAALGTLAWITRHQLGALRHGPQTWGYVESGRLDPIRILEIIGRLGPGAHELICHPGEVDDDFARRRELDALTSPLVREAIATRRIQLCRWKDLF